jgi:RTX calcium-binding nonapeptide repeat (4 copies)
MGTRACGLPASRSATARLLLVGAVLTAALGLASESGAAVTASVARGTLTVAGSAPGERIALRAASGGRLVVDVGDNGSPNFTFLRSRFTRIVVKGGLGNDRLRIDESKGAFTNTERTTLNGGPGADSLIGGRFAETLSGFTGIDTVEGNAGPDTAVLGAGADLVIWDPGDGNDVVQGGSEIDTLRFNGSPAAELFSASVVGSELRLTRNVGPVLMRAQDVETVALNALGGADTVTVNDLDATDVTVLNLDLAVGGVGDAAADRLVLNGTGGGDVVQAVPVGAAVQVNGLDPQVNVAGPEAAFDEVFVNGLGGPDTLSGGVGLAALMHLTLDGGEENDVLNGGNGADLLLGGTESDTIDGNGGNDVSPMGDGNDTFVWDPGDGSDIVEGQGGVDTLLFNGSAGSEIFTASANGGRLLFTRNVGNIIMDTDEVEILTVNALGGTDTVTVNDLAATDITNVIPNLGVSGAGDAAADALTVNGTAGVDVMSLSGSGGSVTVATTAYTISIANAEPVNDTLTVNLSSGDDLLSASNLAATSVDLTLNGGGDDDILVGSAGGDTFNCEAGTADYADGGPGADAASNCETTVNIP